VKAKTIIGFQSVQHSRTNQETDTILQALPIPDRDGQCKLVLRPPKDDKDDKDDTERARQTIREEKRSSQKYTTR
jgi:hypothetical protein